MVEPVYNDIRSYDTSPITSDILWNQSISSLLTITFYSSITITVGYKDTNYSVPFMALGTAVAQWLRCCATNRKVAGSIPDGVIGIFHWHNLSDRSMALGSTQPLTEMSTRSISWW